MFNFFRKKKKENEVKEFDNNQINESNPDESLNNVSPENEALSEIEQAVAIPQEKELKNIENLESAEDIKDKKHINIQEQNEAEKINKSTWFSRLRSGLNKTKKQFNKLFGIINIDDEWLENLEDALITSDAGLKATNEIMTNLRAYIKKHQPEAKEIKDILKKQVIDIIKPLEKTLDIKDGITSIMMVGVNGAGKTTSIGKLCKHLQEHSQKIMLGAGDTFRAAASEQLQAWGKRNNVNVIANGSDPAAVAYDAIQSAKAKNCDVVIIDTAGRLPTQNNLIEELKKIKRVSDKSLGKEVDEVLLVIDGNTGQNALQQVKIFNDAVKITGLIVTKLDGSAKGGIILAIAKEFDIPIYFIGVGEGINDLQNFSASNFVDALFE